MKRIKGTGKAGGETASKKGGSEASAGKPDNGLDAERARLQEKYPMEWTVSEVAKWLDCIDMGQYKMVFIENRYGKEGFSFLFRFLIIVVLVSRVQNSLSWILRTWLQSTSAS